MFVHLVKSFVCALNAFHALSSETRLVTSFWIFELLANESSHVASLVSISVRVLSRFLRTFRQPRRLAVRCGYPSSRVTSR